MRTKRIVKDTLFYILLSAIMVVMMFPVYWLVVTSLQPSAVIFASTPTFIPVENLFASYGHYLQTEPLLLWLKNTLKIAAVVVAVSLLFAVPAGYSISRFNFKGKSVALFGILLTQMLPLVFILIPIFYVFTNIGLGNTHEALMIINIAVVLPVSIWFLKGFFDGVPRELEEAAAIDGANRFDTLWKVIIPMVLPGIAATGTWALILVWDEYLFANTFLNSNTLFPVSVGLSSYIGQYSTAWDKIMIGSFLATLPVAVIFMFFQKYLVSGLTAGAIKG